MDTKSDKPYVIRKGAGEEKIVHAPDDAEGWYRIKKTKDGFCYRRVE